MLGLPSKTTKKFKIESTKMKIELFKLDEQFSKHCLTKTSRRSIQRARSREYGDINSSKFNNQSPKKNVQMLSLQTLSSNSDSTTKDDVSDILRKKMLQQPGDASTCGVTITRDISTSRNSQDNSVTQRSITVVPSHDPALAHGNDNINIVK